MYLQRVPRAASCRAVKSIVNVTIPITASAAHVHDILEALWALFFGSLFVELPCATRAAPTGSVPAVLRHSQAAEEKTAAGGPYVRRGDKMTKSKI